MQNKRNSGPPTKKNGFQLTDRCGLCGHDYGDHSWQGANCPNPRGLEPGQPLYLESEFFYTFPKGWDEARLRDMQAQGGVQ